MSQEKQEQQDFYLPDIGEGIVECELVEWLVAEGEQVTEDQAICDVMTDKALVQIPAMHNGVITKLYVAKGELAKVHAPLFAMEIAATIATTDPAEPESSDDAVTSIQANQAESRLSKDSANQRTGKVVASPAVRRLAREQNIALSEVQGSGDNGRVCKEDLTVFLATLPSTRHAATTHPITTAAPSSTKQEQLNSLPTTEAGEPLTGIRATMAKQMTASLSIPQFTLCDELRLDELLQLKARLTPVFDEQQRKLTLLPFFIKALSLTLADFPLLNARLDEEARHLHYQEPHHIGVAVDTLSGLLVPVLRNCQQLSLLEIAAELERLSTAARAGKLTPHELQGATISLSNVGALGGLVSTPIVTAPQVAIAALGKWRFVPRFNEQGECESQAIMMVCWSADHRVIDGATLARFNRRWCQYLMQPERMWAQLT
ncbi:dihydrolipoamide acetyltransferase [Oceanisphaera profunda]|uniref:Dihydrolipoamide acetyltransferase component of pyruvate dehydrogenase complex n=1 Tax=Oceanisphaera profunda TaxID=1416627 RepID=A0A1Y0D2X5_9GAMM|nr:2-oxo acid dehydrogenase subunit E2 [Oceanisphaera profunda]ART81873.1 dihydrolipoamide acetyltransferase [Oceanisphaera profunda]